MEFLQARRGCKNPSPRRGRTTGPWIKMDGVRRTKEGVEWEGVWQEGWGGAREVAEGVGTGMCHPHILAALLLMNFSHDQFWSQIHKTWEGGLNACTPYHPCCHLTSLLCYGEMSIAFLICLLLPLWPLLYAFDEGLPKKVSFFTLDFAVLADSVCIKLHICTDILVFMVLFSYLKRYHLRVQSSFLHV